MSAYINAKGSDGVYKVLVHCGHCGVEAVTDDESIKCPKCHAKASKADVSADGGHNQFIVHKSNRL